MATRDAQTLIQGFRQKFPQYKDVDDSTLLSGIQKKYPQYADISMDSLPKSQNFIERAINLSSRATPVGASALDSVPETFKSLFQIGQGTVGNLPQNVVENPVTTSMSGLPGVQTKAGGAMFEGINNLVNDVLSRFNMPTGQENTDSFSSDVIPGLGMDIGSMTRPLTEMFLNPQTTRGKIVSGIGSAAASSITPDIGMNLKNPITPQRKVNEIQKAFFPWQKSHTDEYGGVIRKGMKDLIREGKLKIKPNEAEGSIAKIKYASDDVKAQLPKKAKDAVDRIFDKSDELTPDILLKERNRIKSSVTKAEFKGTTHTERGRLIKETVKDIDSLLKEKIPGIKEANPKYAKFAKNREVIQSKFDPSEAHLGTLGTTKGTKTLSAFNDLEPAEIEALQYFQKETGVDIINYAKKLTKKKGGMFGIATLFKALKKLH